MKRSEFKTSLAKREQSKRAKLKRMQSPEGALAIREYQKRYAKENRDRLNELNRSRYAAKRIEIQLQRKGIKYTQELINAIQNHSGKCDICGGEADGRWKILSIDHCHSNILPRGLLCNKCNKGLGHFRDDTELMLRAIEYLKRPPLQNLS